VGREVTTNFAIFSGSVSSMTSSGRCHVFPRFLPSETHTLRTYALPASKKARVRRRDRGLPTTRLQWLQLVEFS
jgi:hypothetical protein